jgi:acyl-coenzyme A thioesterase PaaI-like protein
MIAPVPTISDLNDVLADTPFLQPYGFCVEAAAPGECTLLVPFRRSLERPGGIVSGMTLMGAADVAMWLAIMTLRGVSEHWVTSDMKTAFLRGAREEDISCSARILKRGKRDRCTAPPNAMARTRGSSRTTSSPMRVRRYD